jgi:AcrR family transcriptional regulator
MYDNVMNVEVGRRERKKAQTRAALSRAALRLALERGVDNVTAEAIAEAADVAPRTFHNHFASKEEAIVGELVDQVTWFADAMRARPPGEPIWDAVQHSIVAVLSAAPTGPDQVARMRMLRSTRSQLAQSLTVFEQFSRVLAVVIAERTGTDAARDAYPRLLASVAAIAVKTASELWLERDGSGSLIDVVTDVLSQLRAGLPEPGVNA